MKKQFLILMFISIFLISLNFIGSDLWSGSTMPVMYYSLNETSGDALDYASYYGLFDGVNYGATQGETGKVGNSFDFGGDSRVNISNAANVSDWNEISVAAWFKTDGSLAHHSYILKSTAFGDAGAPFMFQLQVRQDDGVINLQEFSSAGSGSELETTGTDYDDGAWHFVIATIDYVTDNATIYVDGAQEASSSFDGAYNNANDDFIIGGAEATGNDFEGWLDEIGVWNRTLNSTELDTLWNDGNGNTFGGVKIPDVEIELTAPSNESTISGNVTFNSTITPTLSKADNATLSIWYDNGSLAYSTSQTFSTDYEEVAYGNFTVTSDDLIPGDYWWNIEAVNNETNSSSYDTNYTFEWQPFVTLGVGYTSTILETSKDTFTINVTNADGYDVQSMYLWYNGTRYSSGTKTEINSTSYKLSKDIYIPSDTEGFEWANRSFHFSITSINEVSGSTNEYNSSTYIQNITELKFGLCGSSFTSPMLNITINDENLGTEINASANAIDFQTTFFLGGSWEYMNKTYSLNNVSVNVSQFDFCTDSSSNTFYADMETIYSAVGYAEKNYYLTNATLSSTLEELNLSLLNESDAIEFFIDVEQDLVPLKDVTVTTQKFFTGKGTYETVEIDETTSDSGEFVSYLELDRKYKFLITEDGDALGSVIKTASCKEAPCELTLSLRSNLTNIYSTYTERYAQNVLYNLSYDHDTEVVTFDFIDTTGLADYFRLYIWNSKYNTTSSLIFDSQLYSSSGTITANLSDYDGDFVAKAYISRSPEKLIDFIRFMTTQTTEALGLLGLFIAFIIIITIIFAFAFSPATMILSVPTGLIIGKLMGIISLSWTGILVIGILALIGWRFISR